MCSLLRSLRPSSHCPLVLTLSFFSRTVCSSRLGRSGQITFHEFASWLRMPKADEEARRREEAKREESGRGEGGGWGESGRGEGGRGEGGRGEGGGVQAHLQAPARTEAQEISATRAAAALKAGGGDETAAAASGITASSAPPSPRALARMHSHRKPPVPTLNRQPASARAADYRPPPSLPLTEAQREERRRALRRHQVHATGRLGNLERFDPRVTPRSARSGHVVP